MADVPRPVGLTSAGAYGRDMAGLTAEEQKRNHALVEATRTMEATARSGEYITYGDLVATMTTKYPLNGSSLSDLLCTISKRTYLRARCLLSAVVVLESTKRPSHGFFEFARGLGLDVADEEVFWQDAVERVRSAYSESSTPTDQR